MLTIAPCSRLACRGEVPSDKSLSHRAIIFGAMAKGNSELEQVLEGEDVLATIAICQALGANVTRQSAGQYQVLGWGNKGPQEPDNILDCGNSGTSIRLLSGLLAGSDSGLYVLTGDNSLRSRPMTRVVEPLTHLGATVTGRSKGRLAPLVIEGGSFVGGRWEGTLASAQVKSCLLLASVTARKALSYTEPGPSRDHTERMMQALGAPLKRSGLELDFAGSWFPPSFRFSVPGDSSSAAFWVVGALLAQEGTLLLENVGLNPGRIGFFEVLKKMGANLSWQITSEALGEPVGTIEASTSTLKGITIEGETVPRMIDEFPLLALVATQAEGVTTIRNAEELRHKESDRIARIVQGLLALGADITEQKDGFTVVGNGLLEGNCDLDCHHDHRLEMTWAMASFACKHSIRLHGEGVAKVSYPEFWNDYQRWTSG